MSKQASTARVPFRLVKIRTEEFAIFRKNLSEDESFDIHYTGNIRIDVPARTVGVFTSFTFEQKGRPTLKLENSCHFEIQKDYWESQIKKNEIFLRKELGTHLLGLTVGTARGIIHAKKPSWLKEIFLPTLNISEIITEDLTFNLDQDEEE